MDSSSAFVCRMCGQCCTGRGGIVLDSADEDRLSAGMGMDRKDFCIQFAEMHNGKQFLRTGADGQCLFFLAGKGCIVHPYKPAICRAWPFFRGNMIDSTSFALAKDYCPGIHANLAHRDFITAGIRYIRDNCLFAGTDGRSGNALFTREQLDLLAASLRADAGEIRHDTQRML